MSTTTPDAETLLRDRLQAHDLRVTPNRLSVFRTLLDSARPLSVPELATELQDNGLSVPTLYRIVEVFSAIGVTHPVLVDHQSVGYELREPFRSHHDHLVCSACGKVVDLYNCQLGDVLAQLGRDNNCRVSFHQVELHGLCADCAAARELQADASPAIPVRGSE